MSLSLATPALLSLKVRRTANEIISMDADESPGLQTQLLAQPSQTSKVVVDTREDNADEIKTVEELLEQQCFALVAFRNTIHDAREAQDDVLRRFQVQSRSIEARLSALSHKLLVKIQSMNDRIDLISRTLAPKPIFRQLQRANDFERVTGIAPSDDFILLTMASGHLVILNRQSLAIESASCPLPNEALFSPTFVLRKNMHVSALSISSSGKLLFSCPLSSSPVVCLSEKIECFGVAERAMVNEGFDVAVGRVGKIEFYALDSAHPNQLKLLGETAKLKGTVTQVVVDNQEEMIYAMTSRKVLYFISANTFQVVSAKQFVTPLMQISISALFVVVSCAPNDIVIFDRCGKEHRLVTRFEVEQGLRRFCCSEKEILIITKQQEVERRMFSNLQLSEKICERQAADYDPKEYMGAISVRSGKIYLSHGSRISVWS